MVDILGIRVALIHQEPEQSSSRPFSQLLEIIVLLATQGIQFFLTTHSSVVLKKLYLLSQIHNRSIPVLIGEDSTWTQHDLLDGIPNNSIMDEYIRLYEEEVDLALS